MPVAQTRALHLSARAFWLGVAVCAAAVATFLLARLTAWPPHEDETLALFVGDDSLSGVIATVAGERGGAPLHFLIAWAVGGLGGGLSELRLASALFAVASVPLVALLGSRLAGRAAGLVAAAIVSASWMLLFHGVYARMYSLFLATSLLSYLALLGAADKGGLRRWGLWCAATLVMVSAHPYGALVVASQGLYVLLVRARLREAVPAFAVVGVLGLPFWYSDLVLARRFEVGVGGGSRKLDGPVDILTYLAHAAGDFTAGWRLLLAAVLVLALLGLVALWRTRRDSALLVCAVFGTPALALFAARLGSAAAPESRHLIFAFPFLALLVAVGMLRVGARSPAIAPVLLVGLVAAELIWAHGRTPLLFEGEPGAAGCRARRGVGVAGGDRPAGRRAARLRPALPRRVGAGPDCVTARRATGGLGARAEDAAGGRPAWARRLGARRQRHEQLRPGPDDRAARAQAARRLRDADVRALPRRAHANSPWRRPSASSTSPPA